MLNRGFVVGTTGFEPVTLPTVSRDVLNQLVLNFSSHFFGLIVQSIFCFSIL